MTRRAKSLWVVVAALSLIAVIATCLLVLLAGTTAEASPAVQSNQTRTVDWYYWLDTGYPQIQRSRLDGSGVTETVVSNSEMSTTNDFALDPNGDYVYWVDDGHNQIRRKSADGTGSVETLVRTGISVPYRIAVDNSYVYWADNGNDTIKRAQTFGSHTVTTLADSSDGVSNVAAIDVDGSYLYWADNGNDSVREVATFGSNTVTTLVSTNLTAPHDLEMGRNGSYVYVLDRNGTSSTIKRVETFGSHSVTTLASNTNTTPMDDPVALALDPDNDHVYWLDMDDAAVRRVASDGASGSFETLTTSAGSDATDLVVSPDGGSVYWLDNGSNRAKRIASDGSGSVVDVITSGLSSPLRMSVSQETETIAGSCITDAGTLDADYGSHDWDASIDANCPNAFYTFRLNDAADLRITATSAAIDPLPILRKGGIDGEIIALTTVSNGVSTPYVAMAEAGQYTIELVRGANSSNATGSFSASLQTQPALEGCDVNVGTLSSDPISVFGGYDAACGDNRDYFFYLEFQASVSASISAVGFTPRIELRPGAASDSSAATATAYGNPSDFYQQVTSGSYRVSIDNITEGDTYNLILQAFGLPPPTRTPIPTPTPRFQPNQDVRLEPDPRSYRYEASQVYRFRVEGGEGSFPALARLQGGSEFALTSGQASGLDCNAGAQVDDLEQLEQIHLHVCAAGVSANIELVRQSDFSLLATYSVNVPGLAVSTPGAVAAPGGYVKPPDDRIGLSILIKVLCDGANVECEIDLIRNGMGAAGSVALFVVPTRVARGRPSAFSYGFGVALFIIGLLLANYLIGTPMWWSGVALISVFALFGAGLIVKLRRVGS